MAKKGSIEYFSILLLSRFTFLLDDEVSKAVYLEKC